MMRGRGVEKKGGEKSQYSSRSSDKSVREKTTNTKNVDKDKD